MCACLPVPCKVASHLLTGDCGDRESCSVLISMVSEEHPLNSGPDVGAQGGGGFERGTFISSSIALNSGAEGAKTNGRRVKRVRNLS